MIGVDSSAPASSEEPDDGFQGKRGTDFFICYVASDRDWADWVGWTLHEAGYQVTMQSWDFAPGMRWAVYLQGAVTESKFTIVLLSEEFLASAYAKPSWESALIAHLQEFERKLLPIRVTDCRQPGLLGGIKGYDLFDVSNEHSARGMLLRYVDFALSGRAKPTSKPPYPGRKGVTEPPFPGLGGAPPGEPEEAPARPPVPALRGVPLAQLKTYPVQVGADQRIELDLDLLREACQEVITTRNVHAAVDLDYLAEGNRHLVERSEDTQRAVEDVRLVFQRELLHLGRSQAQRRDLIEPLANLAKGLGLMFVNLRIEFILHDTRNPLRSVCAVENGFTGRQIGSPMTNYALDQIVGKSTPSLAPYRNRRPSGEVLKSVTIPFRHPVFGLFAMLCVNVDIGRFGTTPEAVFHLVRRFAEEPDGPWVDERLEE